MTDTRFIQKLRIRNLLSFGPESEEFELGPLNVLIGPNGSGKSNLIEAVSLLRAAPRDLADPIRLGGGIAELLWKGDAVLLFMGADVTATVSFREAEPPLRYVLRFSEVGHRTHVDREVISGASGDDPTTAVPLYRRDDGQHRASGSSGDCPTDELVGPHLHSGQGAPMEGLEIGAGQSILSYLRDPVRHTELTYLA